MVLSKLIVMLSYSYCHVMKFLSASCSSSDKDITIMFS